MILYTEAIIVVKFVFQFSFYFWLSWDAEAVDYFPAILGIQHVRLYACCEVILLVCLFIHRYMLLKFGLWKDANLDKTFEEPVASQSRRTSAASILNLTPNVQPDAQSILVVTLKGFWEDSLS